MAVITPVIDIGILGVLAYYIFKIISNFIWKRRVARQYPQCKPPITQPTKYPFGLDILAKYSKAESESQFPRLLQSFYEQYGHTFLYWTMGRGSIATSEPKNIQAILATNFKDFELGLRNQVFNPLLGKGIFTLDGHGWEHSRALLRPQFVRGQVSDLKMTEIHVQKLFAAVSAGLGQDGKIDLQPLFFRFTIDTATEFLFGESVDSQYAALKGIESPEVSNGERMGFADAFNLAQEYLFYRFRLKDFYWVINPKKMKQATTICHDFIDSYVDKALKKYDNEKHNIEAHGKDKYVFLDAIAKATQDRKVLRDQLLNILLAGRDTTASLLSWTFYFLARNKEVWYKLREEIVNDFGEEFNSQLLTFETMKKSKYLQWVINEALRLAPVVPWNARQAVRDTMLPTGGGPDHKSPIYIKKGQIVEYYVFGMHRRKDLWGEDAELFRPERWGEDSIRKGDRADATWKFLPFNGGPRICLGQQYALTEASYVIIRLMQHYKGIDVIPNEGERMYDEDGMMDHDAHQYAQTLTMNIATGCNVKLFSSRA